MRSAPWPTGLQAFQRDRGRADWPGPEELSAGSRWSGIRLRTRERTHRDTHPQINSFPPAPLTTLLRGHTQAHSGAHQQPPPGHTKGQHHWRAETHTLPPGLRARASAAKDMHTHACTLSPQGCGCGPLQPKTHTHTHTPRGCGRGRLRPKTHTHTLGAVDVGICGQRHTHTHR